MFACIFKCLLKIITKQNYEKGQKRAGQQRLLNHWSITTHKKEMQKN